MIAMQLARNAACQSPDPTTKVGAAIISVSTGRLISSACNTLPEGVRTDVINRFERPEKYYWIEHAERRAIYLAAKHGCAVGGGIIYVSGGFPCADCARAIIQCGIVKVVAEYAASNVEHWRDIYERSRSMLREAHVAFDVVEL